MVGTPIIANAGVPMLAIQWPLMLMALIPVVIVETLVCGRMLSCGPRQMFRPVLKANLVSTLAGVPLAWIVTGCSSGVVSPSGVERIDTPAGIFNAVVLDAAWLFPYEDHLHWMIPAATLVLLVPTFVVSVLLEWWILRRACPGASPRAVVMSTFVANATSYLLLAGVVGIRLLAELRRHIGPII